MFLRELTCDGKDKSYHSCLGLPPRPALFFISSLKVKKETRSFEWVYDSDDRRNNRFNWFAQKLPVLRRFLSSFRSPRKRIGLSSSRTERQRYSQGVVKFHGHGKMRLTVSAYLIRMRVPYT